MYPSVSGGGHGLVLIYAMRFPPLDDAHANEWSCGTPRSFSAEEVAGPKWSRNRPLVSQGGNGARRKRGRGGSRRKSPDACVHAYVCARGCVARRVDGVVRVVSFEDDADK